MTRDAEFLNAHQFEWDKGNLEKNFKKHKVSFWECEEVFFNRPLTVAHDAGHSRRENRFFALGASDSGRLLFVCFTMRGSKVRVISARDMNAKEREIYSHAQEDPQL